MNEDDVEEGDTTIDPERSVSPLPAERPPSPDTFSKLTVREQFAYIKPVLRGILDNRYEPASPRHRAFMNEKTRRSLRKQDGGIGDFSVPEFHQLGKIIQHWLVPKTGVVQAPSPGLRHGVGDAPRSHEDLPAIEVINLPYTLTLSLMIYS